MNLIFFLHNDTSEVETANSLFKKSLLGTLEIVWILSHRVFSMSHGVHTSLVPEHQKREHKATAMLSIGSGFLVVEYSTVYGYTTELSNFIEAWAPEPPAGFDAVC